MELRELRRLVVAPRSSAVSFAAVVLADRPISELPPRSAHQATRRRTAVRVVWLVGADDAAVVLSLVHGGRRLTAQTRASHRLAPVVATRPPYLGKGAESFLLLR